MFVLKSTAMVPLVLYLKAQLWYHCFLYLFRWQLRSTISPLTAVVTAPSAGPRLSLLASPVYHQPRDPAVLHSPCKETTCKAQQEMWLWELVGWAVRLYQHQLHRFNALLVKVRFYGCQAGNVFTAIGFVCLFVSNITQINNEFLRNVQDSSAVI